MKRALACVLSVLAVVSVRADAPIPQALIQAKTVFLINEGADQDTFNDLAEEIRKWGRWTLVDNPKAADVFVNWEG